MVLCGYLATALLAIDTPLPEIQALLRWKTVEACQIYARMKVTKYTGLLSKAVRADFSTVRTAHWEQAKEIAFGFAVNVVTYLRPCSVRKLIHTDLASVRAIPIIARGTSRENRAISR